MMKEIPLDAKIVCVDGEYGKSSHIIIEQNTQKVTHFVVEVSNLLESHKYLVSIERVVRTTPKSVALDCTKKELAVMPSFTEMQFFNPVTYKYEALKDFSEEAMAYRNSYLMWSDPSLDADMSADIFSMPIEAELIPTGEMAVRKGAWVEATDGHIGRVEEFLVDPSDRHITHLVLEEGHLWHKKVLTLPLSEILYMNEDYIYLKLDKQAVSQAAIAVKNI
jgi:uncharacterized protein YrrD